MIYPDIHWGQLIRRLASERQFTSEQLGRMIGQAASNIRALYLRRDITLAQIRKFSVVFGEDLFRYCLAEF